MAFLFLSLITLLVGLWAVLWVLNQEVGNGPRIQQRTWLVVDAHHRGQAVYSDVISGLGDADVLIPGLSGKHLKVVRDGQLYVRPGWAFVMKGGSEVGVTGG